MTRRIALACGGTGGHVFPALSVGRILADKYGYEIVLFGRHDSLEERLAGRDGVPFAAIPAIPFYRTRKWRNLTVGFHLLHALTSARKLLREQEITGVFATGGYVSLPTGLGATGIGCFGARAPLWLLEPNAHAGLANRVLGNRALRVFAGSPAAAAGFPTDRTEITGNPVRPRDGRSREELRAALGLSANDRLLLILGGSQGAHGVNDIVSNEVKLLHDAGWRIFWQTGKREYDDCRAMAAKMGADVRVEAFVDDIYGVMGAADLCVSRSGAGAVAEIALHGIPTVFVPYPFATDNHQETNAREIETAGAGLVLTERSYREGLLQHCLNNLWERREKASQAMQKFSRPDAADRIAARIAADLEEKA